MLPVVLAVVLQVPLSPTLGCNKAIYDNSILLKNSDTSDEPLTSASDVINKFECALLCLGESLCLYHRFQDGTCSLYKSTPRSAGVLAGAIYYTKRSDPCPTSDGFISVTAPRLCFKLSSTSDKKTWAESQSQCQNEGRLIILNTADKHNYITQYLNQDYDNSYYSVWVGMAKVEGVSTWTDGTTEVTQWADGEPDDVTYQNCGKIVPLGLSDVECEDLNRYLCEITVPS